MRSTHTVEDKRTPAALAGLAILAGGLLATAALTGCNTTEGVGEDIEAAGDAISDTARDAND